VTGLNIEAVPYKRITIVSWRWPLAHANDALLHFYSLFENDCVPRHTTASLVFNDFWAFRDSPQCLCTLYSTGTSEQVEHARDLFIGVGGVRHTPGSLRVSQDHYPSRLVSDTSSRRCIQAKTSMVFSLPSSDAGAELGRWISQRQPGDNTGATEYAAVNIVALGGAVSDIAPEDTAFRHRSAKLEVQYLACSSSPSDESVSANQQWLRGVYSAMTHRLSAGGSGGYVNYADEDLDSVTYPGHYWGDNYPKLQNIKRRVDPTGFFSGAQSMRP
jgi:hypothetical protein